MQLTGPEIKCVMEIKNPNNPNGSPNIVIEPFDESCLGSNSYDLHLDNKLKVYKDVLFPGMKPAVEYDEEKHHDGVIMQAEYFESKKAYKRFLSQVKSFENPMRILNPFKKCKETVDIVIPESGLILLPRIGYLGSTVEWTETYNLFPYIDGKSSIGRNFIFVHHTAGRGDDGFCGTWTLEISVMYPTLVKPNMRIAQIYYEEFVGERKPYNENPMSHYRDQCGATKAAALPIDNLTKSR
ncbi:MAG: hypothetical protein LBT45_03130 [Rickettsiales bacterium]|jgi:dCTP deaminase|nr:hypothetical protein [Rickettsiales bacterium]